MEISRRIIVNLVTDLVKLIGRMKILKNMEALLFRLQQSQT